MPEQRILNFDEELSFLDSLPSSKASGPAELAPKSIGLDLDEELSFLDGLDKPKEPPKMIPLPSAAQLSPELRDAINPPLTNQFSAKPLSQMMRETAKDLPPERAAIYAKEEPTGSMGLGEFFSRSFKGETFGEKDLNRMQGAVAFFSPVARWAKRIASSEAKERLNAKSYEDWAKEKGWTDNDISLKVYNTPLRKSMAFDREKALATLRERDMETATELDSFDKEVETRKMGLAGRGVKGAAEMVPYMIQMSAGSPGIIPELATQIQERLAGNGEVNKEGDWVVTEKGADGVEAVGKAALSAISQYTIEKFTSPALRKLAKSKLGQAVGKWTKADKAQKFVDETVKHLKLKVPMSKAMEKASKAVGFDDIAEEILAEEGFQAAVDTAFNLDNMKDPYTGEDLGGVENTLRRVGIGAEQFAKAVPEMIISFGLFGVGRYGMNRIAQADQRKALKEMGASDVEIEAIVNEEDQKTKGKLLVKLFRDQNITLPKEIKEMAGLEEGPTLTQGQGGLAPGMKLGTVTEQDLIDNPDLARWVVQNPESHKPELVEIAKKIEATTQPAGPAKDVFQAEIEFLDSLGAEKGQEGVSLPAQGPTGKQTSQGKGQGEIGAPASKEAGKATITEEELAEDPDLAIEVVNNPDQYSPDMVALAEMISGKPALRPAAQAPSAGPSTERPAPIAERPEAAKAEPIRKEGATISEKTWRKAYDAEKDLFQRNSILERVANEGRRVTDSDLTEVLDLLDEKVAGSGAWQVAWAVSQNPKASEATKKRALQMREEWMRPGREGKWQDKLVDLKARIRTAKALGAEIGGVEETLSVYESGDQERISKEPPIDDSIEATQLVIDRLRKEQETKAQLPSYDRKPGEAEWTEEETKSAEVYKIHPRSVRQVYDGIKNRDATALKNALHPGNKQSRLLFSDRTGMKLPKGVKATDDFLDQWVAGEKKKTSMEKLGQKKAVAPITNAEIQAELNSEERKQIKEAKKMIENARAMQSMADEIMINEPRRAEEKRQQANELSDKAAEMKGKALIAASKRLEAKRYGPKEEETKPKDNLIGKNMKGQSVYEDDRGVRYIREEGIKRTEPVALIFTREGIKTSVEHKGDFLNVEESTPVEKPTTKVYIGKSENMSEALQDEGNVIHIVHKSAKEKGKWQRTEYWVEDGLLTPMGDSQYDSSADIDREMTDRQYKAITDTTEVRMAYDKINVNADTVTKKKPSTQVEPESKGYRVKGHGRYYDLHVGDKISIGSMHGLTVTKIIPTRDRVEYVDQDGKAGSSWLRTITTAFDPEMKINRAEGSEEEPAEKPTTAVKPNTKPWRDVTESIIESNAIRNSARNTPANLKIEAERQVRRAWGQFLAKMAKHMDNPDYAGTAEFIRQSDAEIEDRIADWTAEVVGAAEESAKVEKSKAEATGKKTKEPAASDFGSMSDDDFDKIAAEESGRTKKPIDEMADLEKDLTDIFGKPKNLAKDIDNEDEGGQYAGDEGENYRGLLKSYGLRKRSGGLSVESWRKGLRSGIQQIAARNDVTEEVKRAWSKAEVDEELGASEDFRAAQIQGDFLNLQLIPVRNAPTRGTLLGNLVFIQKTDITVQQVAGHEIFHRLTLLEETRLITQQLMALVNLNTPAGQAYKQKHIFLANKNKTEIPTDEQLIEEICADWFGGATTSYSELLSGRKIDISEVFTDIAQAKEIRAQINDGLQFIKRKGPTDQQFSSMQMDDDTYSKARPVFEKGLQVFSREGKSARDFIKWALDKWGEPIIPYLKRFKNELAEGAGAQDAQKNVIDNKTTEDQNNERREGNERIRSIRPTKDSGVQDVDDLDAGQPAGTPAATDKGAGDITATGGQRDSAGADGAYQSGTKRDGQTHRKRNGAGGTVPRGGSVPGEGTADDGQGVRGGNASREVRAIRDIDPEDNLRIQPDEQVVPSGRANRIKANVEAIRLLRKLDEQNRLPTPEEKRILMQFSGWGDTFQVFGETSQYDFAEYVDTDKDDLPSYMLRPEALKALESWKRQYGAAFKALSPAHEGLLTEKQFQAAKESSLNAHYTSAEIIRGMWDIAQRLGFKGGVAVEPSAGIGHFIGMTPDAYAGKVHWVGVELDDMTGRLLQKLYPASDIQITGFEDSKRTANNSADLVISNFPFGDYDVADPKHKDYDGWSIHNYFAARAIDVVKPGGLVMAITSHHTLDASGGRKMREYLAGKADLVGAIRLPYTAFKDNAGTEVITDILILRKKTPGFVTQNRFSDTSVLDLDGQQVSINRYFADHPEMILGKQAMSGKMYARKDAEGNAIKTYNVEPVSEIPLANQLATAAMNLPENVIQTEGSETAAEEAASALTVEGVKAGSYIVKDGKVVQVDQEGVATAPDWAKSVMQVAKAKKLIGLRDLILKQIDIETNESSTDEEVSANRKDLNTAYDAFVKAHGSLNEDANDIIDDDPEWPLVAAMEDENRVTETLVYKSGPRKGQKYTRSVLKYIKGFPLKQRFAYPRQMPGKAESIEDAVSISVNYKGDVLADYVGQLLGVTPEEARSQMLEKGLVFENPETGLLETPDTYLSGYVREKLQKAKDAASEDKRFEQNVAALEKVQPTPLPAERIYFRLGANWITSKQVQRFIYDVLDIPVKVEFVRGQDETHWSITRSDQRSVKNNETWSVDYGNRDQEGKLIAKMGSISGVDLVEDALNLKLVEASWTEKDANGTTHTFKDAAGTASARDMQIRLQDEFRRWVRKSPTEAKEVEDTYNRLFNAVIAPKTSVPDLETFPNANPDISLRDWQKRVAVRAVRNALLIAHSVGTGKTFSIQTIAMEMRRLKTANKPMIVVQNATLGQFARSFKMLYPRANLLIGNEKRTNAKNRAAFIAQATTRDWDAIVIPQSFFEMIENDPKREQDYVQERIDEIKDMILTAERDAGNTKGVDFEKGSTRALKSAIGKALMRTLKRYKARMDRILKRMAETKDDLICFEKMGVDALLVDEAHAYKRGDFYTKMDRVKGLDANGSDRSLDFYMKTQWIHSKTPGRNVILATGTPISNTLAEMWTMLRYVRPDVLQKFGVETFDDFVGTFATVVGDIEETPSGDFRQVLRLAKYVNGPELSTLWRTGADVYMLDRADLPGVPAIKGGQPTEIVIERPAFVGQFIDFIREWRAWWENLDGKEKQNWNYVPILQYGLARKAAIDMRLVDPRLPDLPDGKVNRIVDEVYKRWQNPGDDADGTQLVFSNLVKSHDPDKRWLNEEMGIVNPLYGIPVFNVFQDIRKKLIARGVPADQIADISELSKSQREATAELIKAGKIRIAFGTTETLGTGLNIQDHLIAIHHTDPMFRPMDFEQRNGRGVRQGNLNKEIEILVCGTKRTLDSTLYQLMLIKQKFITQAMRSESLEREFDDPADESTMSFQTMAAAFSGDPLQAQRFALENEVRRLTILADQDAVRKRSSREMLQQVNNGENSFKAGVKRFQGTIEKMRESFPDGAINRVSIDGKVTTGEEDSKKAMNEAVDRSFTDKERALQEFFDSGGLAKADAEHIKAVKDGKYRGDGYLAPPTLTYIDVNGIPFKVSSQVFYSIPLLADGVLKASRQGSWEMLDKSRPYFQWTEREPWHQGEYTPDGNATTGPAFQAGIKHMLARYKLDEKAVQDAEHRIKTAQEELLANINAEFESENRLKEQQDKLAEVLLKLQQQDSAIAVGDTVRITDADGAEHTGVIASIGKSDTGEPLYVTEDGQSGNESNTVKVAVNGPRQDSRAWLDKYKDFAHITRLVEVPGGDELKANFYKADMEKQAKNYYLVIGGQYVKVPNTKLNPVSKVRIKGFEHIEMFTFNDKGTWPIVHAESGLVFNKGKTRAEIIERATKAMEEQGREKIDQWFADKTRGMLSPRIAAQDWLDAANQAEFAPGVKVEWAKASGEVLRGTIKEVKDGMVFAETEAGTLEVVRITEAKVLPPDIEEQASNLAQGVNDYIEGGEALHSAIPFPVSVPRRERNDDVNVPTSAALRFEDREAELRYQAAKGIQKKPYWQRAAEGLKNLKNSFMYSRPDLAEKGLEAAIDMLRILDQSKQYSSTISADLLRGILAAMGPKKYDIFSRVIILRDLVEDIGNGMYEGKDLPFGFKTAEDVNRELARFQAIASANPDIAEAIQKRDGFMAALKADLVKAELLPEEVMQDRAYFHRQVLAHMEGKEGTGLGSVDLRMHKKGWQKKREGSSKDYNTQYLEAEYEVISQGMHQLIVRQTLDQIKDKYDIMPDLNRKAKLRNLINAYGGIEIYNRVQALRAEIADIKSQEMDSDSRKRLREIHKELDEIDILKPFRNRMIRSKAVIAKLSRNGELGSVPARFEGVLAQIEAQFSKDPEAEEYQNEDTGEEGSLFAFLSWLAEDSEEGRKPALGFFKAIVEREKLIREKAGSKYVTGKDLLPEGVSLWQPEKGNQMYWAFTAPERTVQEAIDKGGMIDPAEMQKALVTAGRKPEWAIPTGLAKTLDKLRPDLPDNALAAVARAINSSWKVWTLLNPERVIRYNINNLSGDLDIVFAYDPRIAAGAADAAAAIYRWHIKKTGITPELAEALKYGVIGSGWSINELPDISEDILFQNLTGDKPTLIKRYWQTTKDFTQWREDILRLAAYRYFKKQLAAGKRLYAASRKEEVDAVPDLNKRAAKLARELVGDYGNISKAGLWLRAQVIPFWSWIEINSPRYYRILKNTRYEEDLDRDPGVAARVVKSLGIRTGWRVGKFALKATILYGLVALWNRLMFPDELEELGKEARKGPFLILGRNEDGKIMALRFQGALGDMLSWLALDDILSDIKDIADGRAEIADKIKEALLAPVEKLVQGAMPLLRGVAEAFLFKKKLWPDMWRPSPVRDPYEHMSDTLSLGTPYRFLAGKPSKGLPATAKRMLFQEFDPGETAYYQIQSIGRDWLREIGQETPDITPTPKQNLLYYYKQSLRYGDKDAQKKYMDLYIKEGGTKSGMDMSVEKSSPLNFIPIKHRDAFMRQLSLSEKELLRKAEKWYSKTFGWDGKEGRTKRPMLLQDSLRERRKRSEQYEKYR